MSPVWTAVWCAFSACGSAGPIATYAARCREFWTTEARLIYNAAKSAASVQAALQKTAGNASYSTTNPTGGNRDRRDRRSRSRRRDRQNDRQKPICFDYAETGSCGRGAACKYLHSFTQAEWSKVKGRTRFVSKTTADAAWKPHGLR
jgi:hypothetical protein